MVFDNFLELLDRSEVPPDDMDLPDILRACLKSIKTPSRHIFFRWPALI